MISLVARCGVALPLVLLAQLGWVDATQGEQTGSPKRIGLVLVGIPVNGKEAQAFRDGMRILGYNEGRDVVFEWKSAQGDYSRAPVLVADLIEHHVDVLVVESSIAARAAVHATATIPIVMALVGDPVGTKLVSNLAHPGGNLTGLSQMTADLTAKRLQLLKEVVPDATQVAVLWNPATPWHTEAVQKLKETALRISLHLEFVAVNGPEDFNSAFSTIRKAHVQAMYVLESAVFGSHRQKLLAGASKLRVPIVYGESLSVRDGGLMSYGPSISDLFRHSAGYVDKILKGAKAGDLPIEQPTKFELVVNLRTAKTLGVTMPESILLRADEVIR